MLGLVTVGMCFLAGARISNLLALGLCAIPVVLVLVLGSSYRRQRLMTFLAPWKDASDAGFQITQSFLAFGSGGLFGVGLGEGKQKLYFLPEAHTDFVLALVGEELGLIGPATVTLLFAFLSGGGSDRRACASAVRPLSGHGYYLVDRRPGVGECSGGDWALTDERAHLTVHQLRGVVAGGQSDRRGNLAQYFSRPACRRVSRWTWWVGSRMTIVIAAGGTGGHLYPAVALAGEFLRCEPTTKVLFVGRRVT